MEESIRHLLEDCQNLKNDIDRQTLEYEDTVFDDINESLLQCNAILIPFEINIRRIELKLKKLKLELKESEGYQTLKTIKAKDEKVLLDTYDISDAILLLKLARNKLRCSKEYQEYKLQLRLKKED